MPKYDCSQDVMAHKSRVEYWMGFVMSKLRMTALVHDDSKILNPEEKATFDAWTPELKERPFGSPEYKKALEAMGAGVKLHYQNNSHHPEHFDNGIAGMNLIDLVEMVCDWMAAAERNGTKVNLDHLTERFEISGQLAAIISNTLRVMDKENPGGVRLVEHRRMPIGD